MWRYIGYRTPGVNDFGGGGWFPYWSNISDGGMDIAVGERRWDYEGLTNTPEANAEFYYGELENYNGDIVAYCNQNGITREDL